LDAWEIASRDSVLAPAGLQRSALIAGSDFHKPKHVYSWKTLVWCEPHRDAIKDCIRRNEHLAMTRYEDGLTSQSFGAAGLSAPASTARSLTSPPTDEDVRFLAG